MRPATRMTIAALSLVVAGTACPSDDANNANNDMGSVNNVQPDTGATEDTGDNNPVDDMGGGGGDDMGAGGGGDMGGGDDMGDPDMGMPSPWTISAHSCVGNRTDALWCDDDQNCFVGCGTTTAGNIGLFATTDGGVTWAAPTTTPGGFFSAARVNTIWRGAGTELFIGGDLPNSAAVVSMDDTGAVSEVFTRGSVVDNSFTVGSFRRASNGFAIAESLTGGGLVQREADGGDPTDSWTTGSGFWDDGDADDVVGGVQILDMEVFNDEFWAVGSRINQPPMAFTPKWTAGDFDFNIVELATGLAAFDGEMWGIDVNADGVAAGGVDQDRNVGMIYTLAAGEDDTDPAAWMAFDVSTIFAGATTWVTDVCRATGDVVYATGRESSQGWGFVLMSSDGGVTFEDVTPYDAAGESVFDDVSRCHAFDDGVIVAGADGLFARYF